VNPIHWDLGDGIVVRTFVVDDDQALFELIDANRSHLRPWMPWEPTTKDAGDTRRWIETCLERELDLEGNGVWIDGALVGGVGVSLSTLSNSGEIGYWLAREFEGRGIVTRACERFFDHAFDDLGLHRMQLSAAVENTRSRAVADRLGMREEGITRDGCRVADGYLDLVWYGILEDEWRAPKGALGG
jgi:ribosomal-protein-serine acetyltransferase